MSIYKHLSIATIIAMVTAPAMAEIASTQYVQQVANTKQDSLPTGESGQILTKTTDGIEWAPAPEAKLYDETGENTDGAMTQAATSDALSAITTALDGKIGNLSQMPASLAIEGNPITPELVAMASQMGLEESDLETFADQPVAFALGNGAQASNMMAVAIGPVTKATGEQSLAIGAGAFALADGAIQIGTGTNTEARTVKIGDYRLDDLVYQGSDGKIASNYLPSDLVYKSSSSVAVGEGSTASGTWSSAVGYKNTASTFQSSAFGQNNTASGGYSSAVGDYNGASGINSSAFGYGNTASGSTSSAVGYSNIASGIHSSAVGHYNIASGKASSAFGFYGKTGENATLSTQIGPGTVYAANTFSVGVGEGLTVNEDGGTSGTAIAYPLMVSGGTIPAGRLTGQTNGVDNNGVSGQVLTSKGDGTMEWADATEWAKTTGQDETIGMTQKAITDELNKKVSLGTDGKIASNYLPSSLVYNSGTGSNSAAVGDFNTASGDHFSSAFGHHNKASGGYSSAFGFGNEVSGKDSSAFGFKNTASESVSSAVGANNTASGSSSSAFGYHNTASGNSSSAVGDGNEASGNFSSAVGGFNTASGGESSAFGYSNEASGDYSSAVGYENTASGRYSSAFGHRGTTGENATFSTQIGPGTVETPNTFSVGVGEGLTVGINGVGGTAIAYPLLVSGGTIPAGRLAGRDENGVDNNGVSGQVLTSNGNGGMTWANVSLATLVPPRPDFCTGKKCVLGYDDSADTPGFMWELVIPGTKTSTESD